MAITKDRVAPFEGVAGSPARQGPAVPAVSDHTPVRWPVVRLFASVFLSLYGDWLTTVALVVVLFQATGSALGPAGYIVARVAPRMLGPALGGRLADRISPRVVMVLASTLQAGLIALLIGAHVSHLLWAIYALVALSQFMGALARPSQGAILPSLVSQAALPQANATYALFFSTAVFVAPALGAALLTRTGADVLFALDALSFVVSALLAASLPRRSPMADLDDGASQVAPEPFRLLAVMRDPVIRLVAVANLTTSAAVTVVQAFLVVAAHDRLGADAAVGYLYAAVGVGGTIGGLVGLRWIPSARRMSAALALVSMLALLALAGFATPVSRLLAVACLALSALATASIDVWGFTEVQRRAPRAQLGRYAAITWMAQYAGMLAGALAALAAASFVGWDRIIEAACVLMLAVVGISWVSLPFGAPPTPEPVPLIGWIDFAEQRARQGPPSAAD